MKVSDSITEKKHIVLEYENIISGSGSVDVSEWSNGEGMDVILARSSGTDVAFGIGLEEANVLIAAISLLNVRQ